MKESVSSLDEAALCAASDVLGNAQKVISSYTSQSSEAELAYTGFGIIIAFCMVRTLLVFAGIHMAS